MKRRTFLKTILPTIFVPKLIIPIWKTIKPIPNNNIPFIKNVYPSMLMNELINIQPMNLPSGKIFYLDFIRNE